MNYWTETILELTVALLPLWVISAIIFITAHYSATTV